jgi:hypothetical protein
MQGMTKRLLLLLCLLATAGSAAAQAPGHIAGLQPDRRPDGAPQVTPSDLTAEQLSRALHGIEGQSPGNVETVAATGRWWVPLRGPGMTPPYDPRGWHAGPTAAASAAAPAASR